MATIIMITGTNASGKTTLSKELIRRFGGVAEVRKDRTICADRRAVFLGRYVEESKYGGVDRLNETRCLAEIAQDAIANGAEYVFCEGSYLNSFGLNLQRLLFTTRRQLVICLYAPLTEIDRRLRQRSNLRIRQTVAKKQELSLSSARKWHDIGVPTQAFNSMETSTENIADFIIQWITR